MKQILLFIKATVNHAIIYYYFRHILFCPCPRKFCLQYVTCSLTDTPKEFEGRLGLLILRKVTEVHLLAI